MKRFISIVLSLVMIVSLLPVNVVFAATEDSDSLPAVSLGDEHSAAIKKDGSLWTWGCNNNGQLGDGTTSNKSTPTKIMDDVVAVSLGGSHSAAIKKDGSLWTWGCNNNGQLGDGTTSSKSTPTKIMDDVAAVSLGSLHSAAIKKDGSLWTWGCNNNGQLGDGTKSSKSTPTKIIDDVIAVDLSYVNSAAIKEDGTLWCWGDNYWGQLGGGTKSENCRTTPFKVMENAKAISLAYVQCAAIKEDGSMWAWGYNGWGQLGDGTTSSKSTPVKIMDDVESLALAYYHSAVIKKDGSLLVWGNNDSGKIGDGTTTDSYTPKKIMELGESSMAKLIIEGENSVKIGAETTLEATRYDENGDIAPEGGITWSCSDESVVKLTPSGNSVTVKGLKDGKAAITATHKESGQSAEFEITVISYVMTLAGGYTVLIDEEFEINYAVQQNDEYVHNDIDIKWEVESKSGNNEVEIIGDRDNVYTRALTVKGMVAGECELVAKVDGAEIGRTKIEVLGNLAETIEEETIYRANVLKDNNQYKFYKAYNSVHRMYAADMELTPAILSYTLDNYLSIFYDSIYENKMPDKVTATEFYESVLLKLLNDEENVKVFGKAGNVMKDYILKYGKKLASQGAKIDDSNKAQLKEMCQYLCGDGLEDVGFIDALLVSGKAIDTFFEEYAKVYQMASCTNEQISAVKQIRNIATDDALKTACDNVIRSIEQAQKETAEYAVSSGITKTAEELGEYAFVKMVGILEDMSPALIAFNLAQEIANPINNVLFKTDDIESDTIDLFSLIIIENALRDAMENAEKTFTRKPTAENAEMFIATADFYKNMQLYGCDICDSLLENVGEARRNQGITWDGVVLGLKMLMNKEINIWDIVDMIFGNDDASIEEDRDTLASIRKNIETADFYSTDEQFTVVFDSNGGSMVVETAVLRGERVTEPESPEKSGYTFTGWYTNESCTAKYDFNNRVAKDITLYAGWRKNSVAGSGGGGGLSAGTLGQGIANTDKKEDSPAPGSDAPSDGGETPSVGDASSSLGEGASGGGFTDLGNHAWAADAINALADADIIKGTSASTFAPAANITRADYAILIVRAFDLTSDDTTNFADVSESDYFAVELAAARNTGIIGGIGDNKFAPRNTITRQDMMVMLYRALVALGVIDTTNPERNDTQVVPYADFDSVADYAKEAVSYLIANGLVNGKNGLIAPIDYTTRAEVAVLLDRILEFIK